MFLYVKSRMDAHPIYAHRVQHHLDPEFLERITLSRTEIDGPWKDKRTPVAMACQTVGSCSFILKSIDDDISSAI